MGLVYCSKGGTGLLDAGLPIEVRSRCELTTRPHLVTDNSVLILAFRTDTDYLVLTLAMTLMADYRSSVANYPHKTLTV